MRLNQVCVPPSSLPHRAIVVLALLAALAAAPPTAAEVGREAFPDGSLFPRLVADPKQLQTSLGLHEYRTDLRNFTAGTVAVGDDVPFYRWSRPGGTVWQLGIDGGVFAQFDMDADSRDLLNADYVVGAVVTRRRGRRATRVRLYHQSTHLGDELLLREPDLLDQRVNFSYESLQVIDSWSFGALRAYGGGELLIARSPGDLERGGVQAGLDGRGPEMLGGRLVAGLDLRAFQHHDWEPSASAKLGVELGRADDSGRRVRFVVEGYRGFVSVWTVLRRTHELVWAGGLL